MAGDLSCGYPMGNTGFLAKLAARFFRPQAGAACVAEENKYRALIENQVDLVARVSNDLTCLYVNAAVEKFIKKKPAECIGQPVKNIVPPAVESLFRALVDGVFLTGEASELELKLPFPVGTLVTNWRLLPERNKSGKTETVLFICRDITRYSEVEARYRILFERMNDGFVVCELLYGAKGVPFDYRFLEVNPAFERMSGMRAKEIVGRSCREIFTETEPVWLFPAEAVVRHGVTKSFEYYLQRLDRYHDVLAFPFGQNGFACVIRDVTERKLIDERVRANEKMSAIGQLAGGVAHDYNNQLAAILGFGEILVEESAAPELKEYAEKICRTAKRASSLTRKLLAFARKGKYTSTTVDVHALLDEVIAIIRHSVNKNIKIDKNFLTDAAHIQGDPGQIQNLFLNLALNARDAMPAGGVLSFESAVVALDRSDLSPGKYLAVAVRDTGVGMDEQTRARLFEPFFTTKDKNQGTGMGLASVYGTVRSHLGAIDVETEPGRGSVFRVFLPYMEAVADVEPLVKEVASSLPADLRVLLIEDEAGVRQAVSHMLSTLGCKVVAMKDGEQAVQFMESKAEMIDVVLSDFILPGGGAAPALDRIRNLCPDLPVILASGYGVDAELQGVIQKHQAHFLQKPFDKDQLRLALTNSRLPFA